MEATHHRQIETTQEQTQKILLAHWSSLQPKHAEQNYRSPLWTREFLFGCS